MNNKSFFQNYFNSISIGLNNSIFYVDSEIKNPDYFFKYIKFILKEIKLKKNKIFFFGNGASSAFANHMALDFSKNGKILSRSLSDSAMLTALSNDFTYEDALLEYLKIEGVTKDDLVITISSSGNSPNIIKVLEYCKSNDIKTLAFSGLKNDNQSIYFANYSIYVPMKTYGIVECIHQIFIHLILDDLMEIYEWDRNEFQNMNSRNFNL